MSGSASEAYHLVTYFLSYLSTESSPKQLITVKQLLSKALLHKDNRGFTPLMYSLYRYGKGQAYILFAELAVAAEGMTAADLELLEACQQNSKEFGVCPSAAEVTVDLSGDTVIPEVTHNKLKEKVRQYVHVDAGNWDQSTLSLSNFHSDGNIDVATVMDIVDSERCDMLEVWGGLPSAEDFFHKYMKLAKPVVFRGAAANFPIRQAFQKDTFLKRYGSERAPASVIPYAASFGISQSVTTLSDLAVLGPHQQKDEYTVNVTSSPAYVFTVASNSLQRKLQTDAPVPPEFDFHVEDGNTVVSHQQSHGSGGVVDNVALQFYLGPAGSGAPVHYHGHAVNTLAYGMKKWYLHSPSDAFYSKTPALEYLLSMKAKNKTLTEAQTSSQLPQPQVCTQRGGDIIYVPTLWAHATLNLQQSIGVAHEFSIEPFCME
jgi:hypothetical protein